MTKEFHGRCNKIEHVAEKHSLAETRGDPVASPRRKTTSELRQLEKASGRSSCSLTTDTLLGPLGGSRTASSRGCSPLTQFAACPRANAPLPAEVCHIPHDALYSLATLTHDTFFGLLQFNMDSYFISSDSLGK